SGTTAQRRTTVNGKIRYNSETDKLEAVAYYSWKDIMTTASGVTIGNTQIGYGDSNGNLISSGDFRWINGSSQLWISSLDTDSNIIISPGTSTALNPGVYLSTILDTSESDANFTIYAENFSDVG